MRRGRIALALCVPFGILALASAPARATDPGKPGDAFKRILPLVKQAASWEPIMPELSYEYRRYVNRRDAEGQKALLAAFKKMLDLHDIVITKERAARGDAELDITAVDAAGQPVHGTIDMELERGGWRIDDLSWSPIEPE
jgi:hypothetical protein